MAKDAIETAPAAASRTGGTVTVACKLPAGLKLRIFEIGKGTELVMGGGSREVQVANPVAETYTVKGNAHMQDEGPKAPLVSDTGFALTFGIPEWFWAKWVEQNREHPAVKAGLIFGHASSDHIEGHAQEHRRQLSGLERIDQQNLPRGLERSSAAA